jgi:cytoskeletal protein CcmA (bactofilin family)
MQLKKPARDARYADPRDRFTEEAEMTEESFEMPEQQPARQQRARVPELESGAPEQHAPRKTASAAQESVVDAHSSFDGRYETQQDLRVQGSISGEVVCRGLLTIEHEATARARIQSRDAHIHGRLEGDIVCTGKLILAASSNVSGTIKAASLVVEDGATLSGNVEASATPPSRREDPAHAVISRPVTPVEGERHEGRTAEPVGAAPVRNGRQAPSFTFVPSDDRRPDHH